MDRTSIIVLVVCVALLFLMNRLIPKVFPPKPAPPGVTNVVSAPQVPAGTNTVAQALPPPSLTTSATQARLVIATNVPEQTLMVTNENARYIFTSHGGGLKSVELVRYRETVPTRRKKATETSRVATLNSPAPVPVLALLDGETVQGDGIFQLTQTDTGVRAEKTLSNGLTIVKDFRLSTNYLVVATVRLENHTNQSLSLPPVELTVGTATPMGPQDNGRAVGVMWYNGVKSESVNLPYFSTNTTSFIFFPRTPQTEYRAGNSNVFWAAVENQFFALAAMPESPALQVVVRSVDLPPSSDEELGASVRLPTASQGLQTAFVFPATSLSPNQTLERRVHLFVGPKEYQTLARIADRFNNNVDMVMGFDRAFGGRFTGFFAKALLLAMNWLHHMGLPYGWAIVVITFIIKVIFWPLTQASTRSMKRMQALQPQMAAIKEKYKDDPVKIQRKTMEFMKEHKVNPMGGCLPMLLQIPVFIGFYGMIQSAIELRGAPFLWVGDLSKPDTLFTIPGLGFVPLIGTADGLPVNPLPLLMGVTMLWQARLQPLSPGMDPTQQKLMRYMPLMFLFMLYNFSAGLTLYWTVQNLLTIAQMKLTKTVPEAATPAAKTPALTPPPKKKK